MHANEAIWHKEHVGKTWETSYRGYTMVNAIRKDVAVRGRFDYFFWTLCVPNYCVSVPHVNFVKIVLLFYNKSSHKITTF